MPRSVGDGGINSNIIGGGLTFFLPLLANLLWNNNDFEFIAFFKNKQLAKVMSIVFKVLLILALLMVTFTLILTQSRGSYLGAVIGLLALAIIKDKRYLWGVPLLAILFLTILQRTAQGDIKVFIDIIDSTRGGGTLPGRLEIWQRALFLIQDFPYTGVGIGTLSPITNMLYPYFHFSNAKVYHAHNMILTVAVDHGLPALVLYSALITSFVVMVIKTTKKANPAVKALLIGLACGLLAHQVYGIMDAYMLGTKLGAIMWIYYGIAAALYLVHKGQDRAVHDEGPQSRLEGFKSWASELAQGLVFWLLLSLFAIAFVNINVVLSLVLAILGGIILGIFLTKGYDLSSMLQTKNA
jgi:O-antigen ligase